MIFLVMPKYGGKQNFSFVSFSEVGRKKTESESRWLQWSVPVAWTKNSMWSFSAVCMPCLQAGQRWASACVEKQGGQKEEEKKEKCVYKTIPSMRAHAIRVKSYGSWTHQLSPGWGKESGQGSRQEGERPF